MKNIFAKQFHFYLFLKTGQPGRYRHGKKKVTASFNAKEASEICESGIHMIHSVMLDMPLVMIRVILTLEVV